MKQNERNNMQYYYSYSKAQYVTCEENQILRFGKVYI